MFYSKSTQGFYSTEIHGSNMPSDVVEISVQTHQDLLQSQSQGKQIVADENGFPVAIDPPVVAPTWDSIRTQRNSLLSNSDWTQLNDISEEVKQTWAAYRKQLRDLPQTFNSPEAVVWPTAPSK